MGSERIKYRGVTMTVFQSASGTWHAQSGYGSGSGPTREAAIKATMAEVRKGRQESDVQSREQSARLAEHESRTVRCDACGVRVASMAQHVKTAKHRNAQRYEDYRRSSGSRF